MDHIYAAWKSSVMGAGNLYSAYWRMTQPLPSVLWISLLVAISCGVIWCLPIWIALSFLGCLFYALCTVHRQYDEKDD